MQVRTTVPVSYTPVGKLSGTESNFIVATLIYFGKWNADENGNPNNVEVGYSYYAFEPSTNEVTSLVKQDKKFLSIDEYNALYDEVFPSLDQSLPQSQKEMLMYYIGLQINVADTFGITLAETEIV